MTEIDAAKKATFDYETDGIFVLNDNQRMKQLYFAYGDCSVATEFKGYMGKINGNRVITTCISPDQKNDNGSPKPYTVTCYSIPQQYAGIWKNILNSFSYLKFRFFLNQINPVNIQRNIQCRLLTINLD